MDGAAILSRLRLRSELFPQVWLSLLIEGSLGLQCIVCDFTKDANKCLDSGSGRIRTCPVSVKVCQIGIGIREEQKKSVPVMGRNCGSENATGTNARLWAKAVASSVGMICEMVSREGSGGIDRRCICAEDTCNTNIWDQVMLQPYLQSNWKESDKPESATLGSNSLENIQASLAAEKGLSLESIIGITVAGVAGIVLLAFVIWCVAFRNTAEDDEDQEAESGASVRTWDEEVDDPESGLRRYKTDLKRTG